MEESKLKKLTVKELRAEAERLGLNCPSKFKKIDLVEAILASQKQTSKAPAKKAEATAPAKKAVTTAVKKAETTAPAKKAEAAAVKKAEATAPAKKAVTTAVKKAEVDAVVKLVEAAAAAQKAKAAAAAKKAEIDAVVKIVEAAAAAKKAEAAAAKKAEAAAAKKAEAAAAKKAEAAAAKKAEAAAAKKAEAAAAKKAEAAAAKKAEAAAAKKVKASPVAAKKAEAAAAKKVKASPVAAKKAEATPLVVAHKVDATASSTKASAKKAVLAQVVEIEVEVKSEKKSPAKASKTKAKTSAKIVSDDILETEALEAAKAKALLEEEIELVEEEHHVEPDTAYIDRGAILPRYIPGTALFALVRDPMTLFVYWNSSIESYHGWLLTAYNAAGQVLQSFRSPERRNGRGYFRVPTYEIASVTLAQVDAYGNTMLKLESQISLVDQSGLGMQEKWVDIKNGEVVYEAPAPGRAPDIDDGYARFEYPENGDAQIQAQGQDCRQHEEEQWELHSSSSWFGRHRVLRTTGLHIGSSDLNLRRK